MSVKALILTLLTLSCIHAAAQDLSTLDSLKDVLGSAEDAHLRSDLLEKIAWEFRKAFPDSTIYYAQQSIDLIESENLSKNTSEALTFVGVAYQYKGDNLKSYDFYTKASQIALEEDDSLQYAHALNSLGRLYFNQGSFLKAYDHFYDALDYFTRLDDPLGLSYVYKSLSELYRSQQNHEKALEMAGKTLEIRIELGDITGQVSVLAELAAIQAELEQFDQAFENYLLAKKGAEAISDKVGVARVNLGISRLRTQQQNHQEALEYSELAIKTMTGSNNAELLNQVRLQFAESLFNLKRYDEAKDVLLQIISRTEVNKQLIIEKAAYLKLSQLYELEGDIIRAFNNYKRHATLNEAWSNIEAARKIERLEARLALEGKEKENELLRLNEARSVAVIERQRFENIALIAVLTLIGILLISFWYVSRKRKQTYMKLQLKNRQIEEQTKEISQQNEKINQQNEKLQKRNRQLADLNNEKDTLMNIVAHDLKSPINRVKGIVQLLSLSELSEEQRGYINLLRQVSDNSTDLIRDLLDVNAFEDESRKLDISSFSVVDIIEAKKKTFQSEADAKEIDIKIDLKEESFLLNTDRTLLMRILDNLISNAIKFSRQGSYVIISVYTDLNGPALVVKDEGPGFTPEDKEQLYQKFKKLSARPTGGESSNGLGLAIVKILCDQLGITIDLQSSRQGSSFILRFPERIVVRNKESIKP